ncbi:DUF937 domain-containing protein [uncultured Cytophaga sp.]|uniref:DUF937 domain-containing protein n=1 Tax=uncultured Cytophaga sp. TaxID=160238 RepID=UPI002625708A|nr:DUF937 domain-containing protein [uncultured Cytophaga sp.]
MLDQLIQMAQQQLAPQLQQIGVPSDKVSGVFNVAKDTVTDSLKNEATSGGLDTIMSMFNGNAAGSQSNSMISSLSNNFVASLASKLGMDQSMATKISGLVIPFIMSKFSSSETGTASSATDLVSQLGFGDIGSSLGNILGGKDKGSDLLGGLGKLF